MKLEVFLAAVVSVSVLVTLNYYQAILITAREDSQLESKLKFLASSTDFSFRELKTLDTVLKGAEFRNKTVILTTLNQAWSANNSMIGLFLSSFRSGIGIEGLLRHLVIVALDQPAFQRCRKVHSQCVMLTTEGIDFSGEHKYFLSEDYVKLVWRRVYFLRIVLELGYNFIFSDADILWFREPFTQFDPEADFEVASDDFIGIETDLRNKPNAGFVHAVSNQRTIALYKLWYNTHTSLHVQNVTTQDVFNDMKLTPEFWALGLRLRFLNTEIFSGFCRKSSSFERIRTMHANCCDKGLESKLQDLELIAEDWNVFKLMTPDQRSSLKLGWRAPRHCK